MVYNQDYAKNLYGLIVTEPRDLNCSKKAFRYRLTDSDDLIPKKYT